MPSPEPNYSKEEFARRGDHIYERSIAPHLTAEDAGKFVPIDADERQASELLRTHKPQAQIWLRLVGSRYVRRLLTCTMQRANPPGHYGRPERVEGAKSSMPPLPDSA